MKNLIVFTFVALSLIVSLISTIHAVDFFILSNGGAMSIFLAAAFEVGQIASLLAIMNSEKMSKWIVWSLFVFLTLFQVMGNVFYSYRYLQSDYKIWAEVFFLSGYSEIAQKRIIAFVSGGFLPIISAGFLKSLSSYLKSLIVGEKKEDENIQKNSLELIEETPKTNDLLEEELSKADIQEEVQKAYLLGRKETNSKSLNIQEFVYSDVDERILRLNSKDFKLRFERVCEVEPKLKKLTILNNLIEFEDLDNLRKYLTFNKSVCNLLTNSLLKMEQNLKNANI